MGPRLGRPAPTLDLNEKEEETEETKKKVTFKTEVPEEEDYDKCTKDELLAWLKKGNGKGNKGSGPKGNKRGFQGNCLYCGAWGHRLNECRKKDADMKVTGKGQNQAPYPNWGNNNPSKGKGKGLSTWNPRVPADPHRCPCHPFGSKCSNSATKGRYYALAEDKADDDLDLDLPMMMLESEEDVLPANANPEQATAPATGRASLLREYPSDRDVAPLTRRNVAAKERETLRQEKQLALDPQETLEPGTGKPATTPRVPAGTVARDAKENKDPKQILEGYLKKFPDAAKLAGFVMVYPIKRNKSPDPETVGIVDPEKKERAQHHVISTPPSSSTRPPVPPGKSSIDLPRWRRTRRAM